MKKNNKGFSLVELIIVIAIMAVLVGVLAPQFIKYVEQSRRGKDIQNADMLKEAIQGAIADGTITGSSSSVNVSTLSASLDTVATIPQAAGNTVAVGTDYKCDYNAATGEVSVFLGTYNLTSEDGAASYKNKK